MRIEMRSAVRAQPTLPSRRALMTMPTLGRADLELDLSIKRDHLLPSNFMTRLTHVGMGTL